MNKVVRLEVFPPIVTLERGAKHRLLVTAHFSDGRAEDFSQQALYISNDKEIAKVDASGLDYIGALRRNGNSHTCCRQCWRLQQ